MNDDEDYALTVSKLWGLEDGAEMILLHGVWILDRTLAAGFEEEEILQHRWLRMTIFGNIVFDM